MAVCVRGSVGDGSERSGPGEIGVAAVVGGEEQFVPVRALMGDFEIFENFDTINHDVLYQTGKYAYGNSAYCERNTNVAHRSVQARTQRA